MIYEITLNILLIPFLVIAMCALTTRNETTLVDNSTFSVLCLAVDWGPSLS